MGLLIRPAVLDDLPALTEVHNYYVVHTHIVFDVEPYTVEQRRAWFDAHNDGRRYRLIVAEEDARVLGSACTGRFRPKEAYDTTVEASVACHPDAKGRGLGTMLYTTLFEELKGQDIHRIVAGIAQPNDASNALHRKMGFREMGTFTQVGRKFGQYWDVRWLERPFVL
jgi:phosphinothricin acetyltransferase